MSSVYNTNTRLSNHVKKEALSSFVQSLVDKKLQSTKKQHRLDHHHYDDVYKKIQSIGIHWLTPSALKSRVVRAFKAVHSAPPPLTDSITDLNSNVSENESTQKRAGRPQNSTYKDLKAKADRDK